MSAKRKHRTTFDFLSYLKGELRKEDRHSFERDMESDPFQQEALEGFETLSPQQAEEDLLDLHASLQKRLGRRKRRTWYSVAATVASILVVGTIFINIYDFNPESKEESFSQEETLRVERESPESDESGLVKMDEAEIQEPLEESVTKKAVRSENADEIKAVAPVAQEAKAMEEDILQVEAMKEEPMQAEAEEPMQVEAAEPMQAGAEELRQAKAEEPDAMVAIEALPEGKQKRAEKRRARQAAPQVAPQVSQFELTDKEQEIPLLMGQVRGVVISAEDMDPLPGASIYVKESDSGIVTDMLGRFSLPAHKEEQTTVIASYVGMVTNEYQLTSGQDNRLVMQPDMAALNEVVVVGYGVQKETNPTGAVQRVQVAEKNDFTVYTGAEPVGGLAAYKMYMEKNIRFPAGDTLNTRAVVVLKFTVEQDGSLRGVQILRSPGDDFSDEAIRLLEEGPHWNPARDENGATDDEVRMRIVFKK